MQTRTFAAWASFTIQLAAGAAVVIWPQYAVIAQAIFALSTLALVTCLALWFHARYRLVLPVQRRMPAPGTTAGASESRAAINLKVLRVVFDPNGPTEMYLDFSLANEGEPTVVRGWLLTVISPESDTARLVPRFVMTERLVEEAFGGISNDDMSRSPVQTGEVRQGRAGFTVQGPTPKERFGRVGTVFELSAEDVRARKFSASYRLSETPP